MKHPLVSVVIATRNRAERLPAAVHSALAQTVADIEILVVDDASSDDTRDVISSMIAADARVRAVHRARAGGAAEARNTGLRECRGTYIAFLDDDDEWLPVKLERQVAVMDADRDVVIAGCHHQLTADDGSGVAYRGPQRVSHRDLLWCNFVGGASFGVVRRSAFDDLPHFDTDYPACEDWDYWTECARAGDVAIVPEVLCRYRDHSGDRLTTTHDKHLAGHLRFAERWRTSMSAACVAYHRARQRLLAVPSRRAGIALGPALAASLPPRVSWILAREIAAARAGARGGDPGRGMRTLHSLIAAAS